jgi:hypothetical protein
MGKKETAIPEREAEGSDLCRKKNQGVVVYYKKNPTLDRHFCSCW